MQTMMRHSIEGEAGSRGETPTGAARVCWRRGWLVASALALLIAGGAHAVTAPAATSIDRPESPQPEPPQGVSSQDWTSIRAAYEAGRHAIKVDEDGTRTARNPGQQWRARFDGRGFTVTPDSAAWTWGLALRRVGFAGAQTAFAKAAVGQPTQAAIASHQQ